MTHKLAISLLIVLGLLNTRFTSAVASTDHVELLSYSQLMELSLEKRIQYIDGVQKMLIELSRSSGHFSDSDPKSRSRLKAWLELLNKEVQTAEAQASGSRCRESTDCTTKLASCFAINLDVKWNGKGYECDKNKRIARTRGDRGSEVWAAHLRSHSDPRVDSQPALEVAPVRLVPAAPKPETRDLSLETFFGKKPPPSKLLNGLIPSGSIESFVREQVIRGTAKCRSTHQMESYPTTQSLPDCSAEQEAELKTAFENQRPVKAAKIDIKADVPPPVSTPATVPVSQTDATSSVSSAPTSAEATAVRDHPTLESVVVPDPATGKLISGKIPAAEIQKLLRDKKNPNDICIAEAKKAGTGPMDLVRTDDYDSRYCMTAEGEKQFLAGKLSLDGTKAPSTRRGGRASKAAVETTATEKVVVLKAPSEEKSAAASGASAYACAPTPMVCPELKISKEKAFVGNQQCAYAGMISVLDSQNRNCTAILEFKIDGLSLKCDQGQTMCNPLLSGAVSATKPICVGRGKDATLRCSKLSSPRDAEKFINRNVTGLQGKWDDFKKGLASMCDPATDSAKFHCAECNIMKMRVFELNARVLLDPCGSRSTGTDAIGSRIKIRTDIKNRSQGVSH